MDLKEKIVHLAKNTKMDNREIAAELSCARRTVRKHAGPWRDRIKKRVGESADKKAFVIYDAHIPYQSTTAFSVAQEECTKYDPDVIIIGGDFVDFRDISFWKNAERRLPFHEELAIAREYIQVFRNNFPDKEIIFLEGNHEARLERYVISKAPELYGLDGLGVADILRLDDLDIHYISNVKIMNEGFAPFSLGKLYILHGHEVRMSWTGVNLARTMYLKTFVNVMFGHHHQSQHYIFKKLDNTHEGAWLVGGLCKLHEIYQPQNNWINGFATVDFNQDTGFFKVDNRIIIGGKVY